MARTFIIAEAGVNHNGDIEMAKRLIEAACEAGADAVKFQTFKAEKLVSRFAAKAQYQVRNTDAAESQFDMIKKLELDEGAHQLLQAHCRACGIEFLSTPFDVDSIEMLVSRFDLSRLKLPSGEVTNAPFLLKAARTGKPVILSTGMSTLDEIEAALGVLAFGYLGGNESPSVSCFRKAYASSAGRELLSLKVILLHCTTEYPAPVAEVNLRAMDTMRQAFGLPVGYSDHTEGIAVPIAAAAREAAVIEKHFTLDRTLPGPDHRASLEPDELRTMVQGIRGIELALGSGEKEAAPSELKNMSVARKSLVAGCAIAAGERFTCENLVVKRPGSGISPMLFWEYLGRKAEKSYQADEVIL
ncbi:N-acetylneuraminate synthase [Geomonas nitrogeniifigens]|uniref:N-acetylneuraminate synthase n=1 Tax=Geomonas diazotrophica TaxID=2843197 RepID=A0ABX8JC45_9BACT|nr:N-acetylneuraminate synthase [Geomonas nitrogeniifigens]QWV95974.1 N-acetylneuraminate synthase [Geomonas nitrogeniifigens]